MAILNYAASTEDLKKIKEGYSLNNLSDWDTNDKIKLILTGDKHIITHGIDILADYNNGSRGLVPTYTSSHDNAVLGKTGWVDIITTMLPMAESIATGTTTNLLSAKQIIDFVTQSISDSFAANDVMVFIGGIENLNDIAIPYSKGYTYRATNNFQFTNDIKTHIVSGGDIVIAIRDSITDQSEVNSDDFIVVEANINGSSELSINDTVWKIYGEAIYTNQQFYAPTGPGKTNQILFSTNGTPVWKNQSEINAGLLNGIASGDLLTSVSADNGNISVTVGGGTKTATASGNWSINADSANKVNHSLSIGNGLSLGTNNNEKYDGSADRTLNLLSATTSTIGGIKIGYTSTGKTYAVKLDTNNNAYVEVPWTDSNVRDIKINDKSIGSKTLNIKPSAEIHIIKDDETTDEYEIGFGLSWYNISTKNWEYTTNN